MIMNQPETFLFPTEFLQKIRTARIIACGIMDNPNEVEALMNGNASGRVVR